MPEILIIDIVDEAAFRRIPPCADPGFDHRSCDFWEDADRGSKAARLDWLVDSSGPGPAAAARPSGTATNRPAPANPFLADLASSPATAPNPFVVGRTGNPFLILGDDDDAPVANPFAPPPKPRRTIDDDAPRKLQLLDRGAAVAGSYAKVLLVDDQPAAYAQFGPLSAYPRAQRTRELYPSLPDSPLPAVITCIATTAAARGSGLARALVADVCTDLGRRGFAAVETYPAVGVRADGTSAATPRFWESVGFTMAIADPRFPVMRRDLA